MKNYEYKLYDRNGQFKAVITAFVTSAPMFTSQINGGQGEMTIDLNANSLEGSGEIFVRSDIVKVFVFSSRYKSGKLLYSGFIRNISRSYQNKNLAISLSVVGLASLLANKKIGVVELVGTTREVLNKIVNRYRDEYSDKNISLGEIAKNSAKINLKTDKNATYMSVIQKIAEIAGGFFIIDVHGKLNFYTQLQTIFLGIDAEISNFSMTERLEDIRNVIELEWEGGTVVKQNTESISKFGKIIEKKYERGIKDEITAQTYAENFLKKRAHPFPVISMTVRDTENVDIENIKPGICVKIQNLAMALNSNNSRIAKISYNSHSIQVELSSSDSLSQEFLN
ncbi:MAG: hypothetical protein Q4A35_00945 [Candidatus Gracilibacteria bacterium]|nr:hypothetical protein [Candidatus Gracilibacteria bacterium]